MSDTQESTIEMYEWNCASCGVIQWMPSEFDDQLRKSHKEFYCVNGHGNVYNESLPIEDVQGKLMNEYSKNAQLEKQIEKLKKSVINRIFKP